MCYLYSILCTLDVANQRCNFVFVFLRLERIFFPSRRFLLPVISFNKRISLKRKRCEDSWRDWMRGLHFKLQCLRSPKFYSVFQWFRQANFLTQWFNFKLELILLLPKLLQKMKLTLKVVKIDSKWSFRYHDLNPWNSLYKINIVLR